jgi:hypothetical protein
MSNWFVFIGWNFRYIERYGKKQSMSRKMHLALIGRSFYRLAMNEKYRYRPIGAIGKPWIVLYSNLIILYLYKILFIWNSL